MCCADRAHPRPPPCGPHRCDGSRAGKALTRTGNANNTNQAHPCEGFCLGCALRAGDGRTDNMCKNGGPGAGLEATGRPSQARP